VTWFILRRVCEHPLHPATQAQGGRSALDLLRQPMMRRLLIVNWLLASCWDVHTFVVPLLGHERDFSASVIGTILGAFAVAATVIRMCLPWIARHWREHQIVTGAMLATGVLFGLYPFMPSPWSMGACSVLLGLVLGSVQPMIMSTLHQITPEHRQGEALGLRLMSINASSVLMPSLFGAVGAVAGVAPVFWVVGASVGLGSRMAWRLRPGRRHQRH
jgi:MFS family permease